MSEWQEFYLEDLAEIHNNKRVPLSSMQRANKKGVFPYYGASGIVDYIDEYAFDGEYVLISEDGENLKSRNTPIAFKATGKFWVNNHAHIVKGKKDFHNNLIIHYFRNLDLNEFITGAVQPKLNKASLTSIPFYLPKEEEEQKAIASVLSSLDDKIDLLHRQNITLERIAETLFRQWFVEEAQEDWEERPIGELVKVIDNRGKTPPYSDIPSAYPLIEVNALTGINRLVDYSVVRKFVDEQTFKTWFRGHPKKYDSLLSTVGSIGEIAMFLVERGSIAQNVIALSAVNICPIYLFEALKNIKDEIKELNIGSVQPSIKVPHLLSLKIKIPSKDKLDNFSIIVKSQLEKMVINHHQIQTLEKLRDNLLPKLMSGEVRVEA